MAEVAGITSFFPDFNVDPFTAQGGFLPADDQHNPKSTGDLDGSDDFYTSTVSPISTTIDNSIGGWAFVRTGGVNANMIFSQSGNISIGFLYRIFYDANANRLVSFWETSATNYLLAETATGSIPKDKWFHFTNTINGTENLATSNKIYIEGVEGSYFQQVKNGTGFSGLGGILNKLTVGALQANGGNLLTGLPSRYKARAGTILNSTQALQEFNNEDKAIGEGFVPSMYPDMSLIPNGSLIPNDTLLPDKNLFR